LLLFYWQLEQFIWFILEKIKYNKRHIIYGEEEKVRKVWLVFGLFLCFFGLVYSYVIVGNTVIQEDDYSKLVVYPHTASSPALDFEQFFELTNKTVNPQEFYAGYKFDTAIQSGKIFRYNEPVFGWVEKYFNECNPPYNYVYLLNDNLSQNPHWVKCFKTMLADENVGYDYNIVKFDSNFSSGSFDLNTINKKYFGQVSGGDYTDFSDSIIHSDYLNDAYYYFNSSININAEQTLKWKIKYVPGITDLSRKWELVYFTGISPGCILNGTCNYVHWLDPWWNPDWNHSRTISIASVDALDQNFTVMLNLDTSALVSAGKMQSDCEDLRIIYLGVTDLDRYVVGCNAIDTNVFFKLQNSIESSTTDKNYFLYYGNDVATNPPDNNSNIFRWYENFDNLADWNRVWDNDFSEISAGTLHLNKDNGNTSPPTNFEGYCWIGDSGNRYKNFILELDMKGTAYSSQLLLDYNATTVTGENHTDENSSVWFQFNQTSVAGFKDVSGSDIALFNQTTGIDWDASDWNHLKIEYKGDLNSFVFWQGGKVIGEGTDTNAFSRDNGTICIKAHGNSTDSSDIYLDKIFLRSIVVNEPTITLLNELSYTDVNVNQPTDGNYLSYFALDGNASIEFNLLSFDSNHFLVDVNYNDSNTLGGTPIYADLNITNLALNGSERTNQLQCDGNNFSSNVFCSFDLNIFNIPDGNHFIVLNAKTESSEIYFYSNSFVVDNTSPSIFWDGNHNVWQNFDANLHLTCVDAVNCTAGDSNIAYRLDSDSSDSVSYGSWLDYDTNLLISTDGNWAIDFNSTDASGNIGDINTFYVLLDQTTPVLENSVPSVATTQTETSFSFVVDVTENGSGTEYCDYNVFADNVIYLENQTTPNVAGQCTVNFSFEIPDTELYVVWDANDLAGNSATDLKSFVIKLLLLGGGEGGAGGAGGGGAFCREEGGFCNFNRDCCSPLICVEGACTDVGVITERIVEVDLSTSVMNVLPDQNRELIVTVLNKTDKVFFIEVSVDENLSQFLVFQGEATKVSLNEYERKTFTFLVVGIDENFTEFNGIITVNANLGQETHEKNFKLTTQEENFLFALLGYPLLGENITVGLVIGILIVLGFVFNQIRKKEKT